MFHRPFNRPAFSRLVALTACVLSAALAASACSSDDAATDGPGSIPPPGPTGSDGGKLGASDGAVPLGPSTTFRVAHLSPDLPPIDFCYRNTTSDAWVGPVLNGGGAPGAPSGDAAAGNDAAPPSADAASADAWSADASPDDAATAPDASLSADAGAIDDASVGDAAWLDAASASDADPGDADDGDAARGATHDAAATDGSTPSAIAFLNVTDYANVAGSGTFDFGLVAAGSTGCAEPLAVSQVTLGAGKRATIAIVGLAKIDAGAASALAILAFTDDPSVAEKAARVRFVNAALGNASRPSAGALVASLRTNGASTPLAADIEPSHAATPTSIPPVIDALGYDDTAPVLDDARFMIDRVDGTWPSPWAGPWLDLALRAGSIHTGFIVNGNSSILRVVWCNDTDVAAPVARCTVLDPSP